MTTSKTRPLCSLTFGTQGRTYDENLAVLLSLIAETPENAIVLAPEVCLTNFDYDSFDAAADFAAIAGPELEKASRGRTLILTMIVRKEEGVFNVARVYHDGALLHEQAKAKLFSIGEEEQWFTAGGTEAIVPFDVEGIRIGILVCFELRFTALWEQLRGAEIICIPAQWGRLRAAHYDILGQALAVANECYVLQSDTANSDTTGQSGIITPFGECVRNGADALLVQPFEPGEVKKMRRYLDTGIR
ncbi:carbon-nitrogen hydrolase family protein [Sulfurimonas diazotrophicus]|uniref:Carbon-nitrogen hydrolase family protein n=1 Tax=Sulfurimonas diazotrophicus TaxID=3131939 RepID=A0ABZ3H981_9BACT